MLKTDDEQRRLEPPSSEGRMKASLLIVLSAALFLTRFTTLTLAQTAADSAAIRATALDYIEGWYTNDAARMERALHPKLAKRMVWADSTGKSHVVDLTAQQLVQGTRSHPLVPATERRKDVQILNVFGNAAVVRIDAQEWVDYLQLIKWNGSWKIINVVWENRRTGGRADREWKAMSRQRRSSRSP
jgi:hypothetical protein